MLQWVYVKTKTDCTSINVAANHHVQTVIVATMKTGTIPEDEVYVTFRVPFSYSSNQLSPNCLAVFVQNTEPTAVRRSSCNGVAAITWKKERERLKSVWNTAFCTLLK